MLTMRHNLQLPGEAMNMKKIGMFEAKTHFSEIIAKVQNGEEVCITNRDQVVAFIVPAATYYKEKQKRVFAKLIKLKKKAPIGTVKEVIQMRDEGRK